MQFDPSEPSVEPGQRKTVDIVIADADQGVSAYDFAVEVADPTVATITDAEFVEFGGQLGSIDIAENGSRVSFEEAVGDRDPADPTFTIAQLTVTAGEREGTTQLTVDNAKIEDNNFNEYDLESRPATVTVIENVAPDVTGNGEPAQDVNGDGLYEDINGDGTADIFDVQALFANQGTKAVQNNAELFDFTGDGSINIFDVQALFEQVN
jgi:hypothetical protein